MVCGLCVLYLAWQRGSQYVGCSLHVLGDYNGPRWLCLILYWAWRGECDRNWGSSTRGVQFNGLSTGGLLR